jgi:spore coat protein U-like protein
MRRRRPARDWSRILIALTVAAPAPAPARAAGGASCGLSATPLAFGNYVPASSSPTDFTATITVTCSASGTTPVPISGTINLTGAGGPAGRHLTDGAHQLRYQLYRDPARSAPWGDGGGVGAASISGVVGPTTSFRQALTVYGRILARQSDARVGNYTDHFTVVLNY